MVERTIRLQIMLESDEMKAIEDWRFGKRMPSRASAIRELLRRGLASEGFAVADSGKRSGAYGVVDAAKKKRRLSSPAE
jgi:hypothetical protein